MPVQAVRRGQSIDAVSIARDVVDAHARQGNCLTVAGQHEITGFEYALT